MNRVLLTGRLTRDPEMRSLASGKTVTQFSLATNDYRGGEVSKAEYHTIVTWDRLAEICAQYLGKGQLVAIEGRIQTRQWEDDKKLRHWKTEIVAGLGGDALRPAQEGLRGRIRRRRRSRPRRTSSASSPTSSKTRTRTTSRRPNLTWSSTTPKRSPSPPDPAFPSSGGRGPVLSAPADPRTSASRGHERRTGQSAGRTLRGGRALRSEVKGE